MRTDCDRFTNGELSAMIAAINAALKSDVTLDVDRPWLERAKAKLNQQRDLQR